MRNQNVLLLNASNMDTFPVYPYAFIQVPAVARRAGVTVICRDMLGVPQERWEQSVQALIERYDPIMILITLRNTDSLNSEDYDVGGSGEADGSAYYPIERTKELIAAIRVVSNLKIVVGGFGFSLLPDEIMHYLHPDFGVFGGADAFFGHFEDIQAGNLEEVANLLYFQEDKLHSNPRLFFPPLAETEYTPQAIREMMAFYDSFPSPGFQGAPVEIMRGCIHSCVFCSEPHVGGRQVRYRDLSAVMGDIATLVNHGITQIYIISSELNPESNEFVLELADEIRLFNERQTEDRKVNWFGANYLLKFSLEEYERLYDSGFTGGWFDITALDDENAGAMRTPYRNASLLTHLKTYVQFERKRSDQQQAREASQSEVIDNQDKADRKDRAINWSLFLGNPATNSETIRNTLRIANRDGLAKLFSGCGINTHVRVFDYENPDEATLAVTSSVTPNLARTSYLQIFPSFAYPPALLQEIGSEGEIERMFDHIAKTYLSKKYQESRDWHGFVKRKATPESITKWLGELSDRRGVQAPAFISLTTKGKASEALQRLFSEEPQVEERYTYENLAKQVVDSLLSACLEEFPDLYGSLGFPTTMDKLERMTPYDLTIALFERWSTEKELVDELTEQTKSVLSESMQSVNRFCIQAMLYRLNVQIRPKYRGLFVSDGLTGSE